MGLLQEKIVRVRNLAKKGAELGLETSRIINANDYIDIAVIGEIKRGKSTFLNALMQAKVFPSRASVCTSAVTILTDGPVPTITAIYKPDTNRETSVIQVPQGMDPYDSLMAVVSKEVKRASYASYGQTMKVCSMPFSL